MKSRRDILVGTTKLAALVIIPRAAIGAPSTGIEIINSNQSFFNTAMDMYFPALESSRSFIKWRSTAVIVRNTGPDIYALRLKWQTPTTGGISSLLYRRRFLKRATTRLIARSYSVSAPLLKSGDLAVVTPAFFWTAKDYKTRVTSTSFKGSVIGKAKLKSFKIRYPVAMAFMEAASNRSVSVTIDSYMTATATFGKTAKVDWRRIRTSRNAEHDEATHLWLTSGAASGTVDRVLMHHAAQMSISLGQTAGANNHRRTYLRARAAFAKKALRLYNAHGSPTFINCLATVRMLPKA